MVILGTFLKSLKTWFRDIDPNIPFIMSYVLKKLHQENCGNCRYCFFTTCGPLIGFFCNLKTPQSSKLYGSPSEEARTRKDLTCKHFLKCFNGKNVTTRQPQT